MCRLLIKVNFEHNHSWESDGRDSKKFSQIQLYRSNKDFNLAITVHRPLK